MNKLSLFFILFFSCFTIYGQPEQDEIDNYQRDLAFYNAIDKWFSAWELVSGDVYNIESVRPVEFVFFDDKYVYSTSAITIKNGVNVKGRNLLNLNLTWKKTVHNDSITLPDKTLVPIALMSFAAEIPGASTNSFFVMPLPSFWENVGITSKELGIQNLVTGVFIHEFSHSQQFQNFGKQITEFENSTTFDVEFSDDVVQHIFGKDTSYLKHYTEEVNYFYSAIKNKTLDKNLVNKGLMLMKNRQKTYFNEKYQRLNQIDNFFLTMEGLGQYSMYRWLTHPTGANIKNQIAIEGVRRNKKWWSQDEGFALFLILDKLVKSNTWAKSMFSNETVDVIELIDRQIK